MLPILHLNGYKISNPTVLARIEHEELEQFIRGCGWTPYFVEGDEPEAMHQLMAATLDGPSRTSGAFRAMPASQQRYHPSALAHDCAAITQGLDGTESRRWPAGGGHIPSAPGAAAGGSRACGACRRSLRVDEKLQGGRIIR